MVLIFVFKGEIFRGKDKFLNVLFIELIRVSFFGVNGLVALSFCFFSLRIVC